MDCGTNCSLSLTEAANSKRFGHIDTKGLETLISSGVPLVILDARSGKWDNGKRIATARSLTAEATAQEVEKLIPSKNSLVVVYCSNIQCPASSYLAEHLAKLGYFNVLKYEEGIQEWINTGRSVRQAH